MKVSLGRFHGLNLNSIDITQRVFFHYHVVITRYCMHSFAPSLMQFLFDYLPEDILLLLNNISKIFVLSIGVRTCGMLHKTVSRMCTITIMAVLMTMLTYLTSLVQFMNL